MDGGSDERRLTLGERLDTNFFILVVMPVLMVATLAAMTVVPWAIGFTYVRRDADRRGQPGWLWALLTIPLSWLAILGYLLARSLDSGRTPAR